MICSLFYRGVGLFLIGKVTWWPVCGVWFWVVYHLSGVWACLFGWFACWQMFFLYRADGPFPMFIGEVLSVFRFLWEPASCTS